MSYSLLGTPRPSWRQPVRNIFNTKRYTLQMRAASSLCNSLTDGAGEQGIRDYAATVQWALEDVIITRLQLNIWPATWAKIDGRFAMLF